MEVAARLRSRRRSAGVTALGLSAALAVLTPASGARADITLGPWTFDDLAFSDDVLQLEPGNLSFICGAVDLFDALVGYSPDRQIVNTGFAGNANDFAFVFLDLEAVNGPGPDLVFFESRFSADPYEVAVRPVDGVFTDFIPHDASEFQSTGVRDCADIFGLEIELSDYGLPAGARVDALRFRALERLPGGNREGDPLMAAVLACSPEPDMDGDGVPDRCDCDPVSAGPPDEPERLLVDPDRETFRFTPPPFSPNALFQVLRGELADLRATGVYELTCVADDLVVPEATDATLPGAGRPLYYLAAAFDCLGDSGLGARSDGVARIDSGAGCP